MVTTTRATADMTLKQILAEVRPKPLYYSNTQGKGMARPCLLCGDVIQGKFDDLETHAKRGGIHANIGRG